MTVMRGYYVTHDLANDRVGFIPQKDSTKAVPVYDPAKTTDKNSVLADPTEPLPDWAVWTIVGIAVAVAVIVVVVLVLVPSDEDGDMTADEITVIVDNIFDVTVSRLLASPGDASAGDFVQAI